MLSTTQHFTFYTTRQYFIDLTDRVGKTGAGDKVTVAGMAFMPEQYDVRLVLEALGAAATRGANVTFLLDAYPFLIHNGTRLGPLVFNCELPLRMAKPFRLVYEALKKLESQGARFAIINQPGKRFASPFHGRSHIKLAIINSRVYIGGCNLDSSAQLDMMAGWDDPGTEEWLSGVVESVIDAGSVRTALDDKDVSHAVDPTTSLLIDAGVPGQSLILNKALDLIDEASKYIVMTCQYYPNDVTGRHLLAAHKRGVKVTIYYTHPSQRGWPYNMLFYGVVGKARLSLPRSFFRHALKSDFMHAKLIATDKAAIMGSNNYVTALVKFGTAEAALLSYDQTFRIKALETLRLQVPGLAANLD